MAALLLFRALMLLPIFSLTVARKFLGPNKLAAALTAIVLIFEVAPTAMAAPGQSSNSHTRKRHVRTLPEVAAGDRNSNVHDEKLDTELMFRSRHHSPA